MSYTNEEATGHTVDKKYQLEVMVYTIAQNKCADILRGLQLYNIHVTYTIHVSLVLYYFALFLI